MNEKIITLLLLGCMSCGPGEVPVEAELVECVDQVEGTIQSCEDICAEKGSSCVESGCEGATYVLGTLKEVCEAPESGGPFNVACELPIDWGFGGNYVMCCCEVQ